MLRRLLLAKLLLLFCALTFLGACANPTPSEADFLKPTRGIRGIFEDSRGNLWFSSPDWICRVNPSLSSMEDGRFTYFERQNPAVIFGRIQEDADGNLLMQDSAGIHRFDGQQFRPHATADYDKQTQWQKAEGDLWFGAENSVELTEAEGKWGVYRYHNEGFSFLAFPPTPSNEQNKYYPLTSGAMQSKNGKLWFGTFEAAFGFDGNDFDFIGRERMGRANDPRHIGIRGYLLDSRDNLWMADNGAGVYVFDGHEVIHFTAVHNLREEDTEGPSLHRSFSLGEDSDGNIWIGTAYSGIWRYTPSASDPLGKGTFTNFTADTGGPEGMVWTMHPTKSGNLLFGTEEPSGVYKFDGSRFQRVY